jgi:putative addiction module killer protein
VIIVRRTQDFARWLDGLRDLKAKARIMMRLDRVGEGHFGDAKSVGEGIGELRIDAGPGYRIYFARYGRTVIVLLCGGDKDSQDRDIAKAKSIMRELKDREL